MLYNTDVGVKYKMSNIQAAPGLAQLERLEEIVAKRRQIFTWYSDRLSDIDGITLNIEREGYFNNFYVPTMVLGDLVKKSAETVMAEMTEAGVMNRPFFRCISKMMPQYNVANTPTADRIVPRGINLPCASMLEEDDVQYACDVIRRVLTND